MWVGNDRNPDCHQWQSVVIVSEFIEYGFNQILKENKDVHLQSKENDPKEIRGVFHR